jgi:hypothetical protein
MKKRKFQDWEFEQIHKEFGCIRHYKNFPMLETWQNCQEPINTGETKRLEALSERLFFCVETWNEDELKFFFISPLIDLISFEHEQYKAFTQRKLSAVIGDWQVGGIVDFVIATGIQHPVQPFFFLHEYKQERKRDNDPLGQLLIEMLVAQQQNENKIPLYGCYVVGRYYFFVVLDGQEYSVSNGLNGSSIDDIMTIFRMFRFVKRYIEAQLGD